MQTDLRRISRLIGNLTRSTTINLPRGVTISIISRRDPIDSVLHERLLVAAFDSSSINNAKITIFIERRYIAVIIDDRIVQMESIHYPRISSLVSIRLFA